MQRVKRILWIDDYSENRAGAIFPEEETNIVQTMDQAIHEMTGNNLYMYDTIVLDINFENGVDKPEDVIEKLRSKIYLSKDQDNKKFIINNGGYLLFLYLLECGYPSDRIAFLTGNAGIIGQLRDYNEQCLQEMSKDEISDAFIQAWKDAEEDLDKFDESIDNIQVGIEYKVPKFYNQCVNMLIDQDWEGVKNLVASVVPQRITDPLMNTGDQMIFRFHDANLEAPVYFTKNDNDISGHNLKDAREWLKNMRTDNRLVRWLILGAGDFVENVFIENEEAMISQIHNILKSISGDGGMRTAFRQMYFVFDGLRLSEHRGIYYQAVSAMLIPFEAKPKSEGANVRDADYSEIKVRRMFAWCLKQARNYCTHNQMGTTMSNETTLFLIIISMTAILNRDQWNQMEAWYQHAADLIEEQFVNAPQAVAIDFSAKVDGLIGNLFWREEIDKDQAMKKVHLNNYEYTNYTSRELMQAYSFNKEMDKSMHVNVAERERYYVYTIAAYILKWFDYATVEDVNEWYGQSVAYVFETAQKIVEAYVYPVEI